VDDKPGHHHIGGCSVRYLLANNIRLSLIAKHPKSDIFISNIGYNFVTHILYDIRQLNIKKCIGPDKFRTGITELRNFISKTEL
jgi:hypothetical protein